MTRVKMEFPKTWKEYEGYYGFKDEEEVYTNGSRLIPSFRVQQWLDHLEQEPCDDAISRQAVLDGIEELKKSPWATDKRGNGFEYLITEALDVVAELCVKREPSVNPQPDISKDGTLTVHVKDGSKVSRVLVCGDNHWGGLYYPEQEPKTGHWIDILAKNNKIIAVRCSYCQNSPKHAIKSDFCPNCGARMESEET